MPNNSNTPKENFPLDAEDWEIAFEPYLGNHSAALTLGFNLMVLKAYLSIAPLKIEEAIKGIDRAMDVLFPYTDFHEVSYVLFRRLSEGKLSREEEKILEALGIRF